MSAEKEKMEKLGDLLRFIDLMVRQTCRRAHYDNQTRIKVFKEDKDSIYSSDHLKKVYDKPREYVHQLVKNPSRTLKGLRVENVGPLPKKDSKFTEIEEKMLLDFVKKVQEHSPKPHFIWIDLQHYLFYAYRHFACQTPKPTSETLSSFFVCEMRELLHCLRKEDESQVWLRIFTLLREYCIFAQWHYSQNDKEEALKKFFIYYEAMLTAAKSLIPVFMDFERDILFRNYRVCWIDFNTFIFIRFFYESDRVKSKIDECLRTKRSPGDTPQTFASLNKLKRTWSAQQTRIALINQEGRLSENTPEAVKDKKVIATHKKLLSATFWVDRSKEIKKLIDVGRMDHNIFDLLRDKQFFPEGPGLNKNGQCICEECLIAKYKSFLDSNDDFSIILSENRTTYCRKCRCILDLEQFQRHVNEHIRDVEITKPTSLTRIISEKMDFVKLGDSTIQLSEMLNEKLKISADLTKNIDKVKKHDMNSTKIAFEKFLQMRKDPKNADKFKNGRIPSLRDELLGLGFGIPLKEELERPDSPNITAEKLAETEILVQELRRNGHKSWQNPVLFSNSEDSTVMTCLTTNEDLDQPKKCDCTYCEVFGVQRIIEPRDKLRVRLYKRRERRREPQNAHKFIDNEHKNKVESRVPLPPSPSNLPSTPLDFSEHSITVGKMNEIRGLINYIEGNPAKNKAELAQKKAAKKARQREKKEQEKLQAELEIQRKLEEQARQEQVRRKELEKEKERQEEQKRLEEAKIKKKLKKQRQAQKRQELANQKTTIEETIPAMVTIKRIPGGENSSPSVTITLKGCTPDQDKLLTTLVEEPTPEINTKPVKSQLNMVTDNTKGHKKKKNGSIDLPSAPIPQLSKEPKRIAKDVKVTLAVDKNPTIVPGTVNLTSEKQFKKTRVKDVKTEREPTQDEIRALGNFRLPPGITITKVEGPVKNKTYLGSDANKGSSVLGKSGVIVVDTEKLIQKTETDGLKQPVKVVKKNKKKSKKEQITNLEPKDKPKMVTLRNPMFHQFQSQNVNKTAVPVDESAPAAIFTSENGMVTIRSSRLQQSLENGRGKTLNNASLGMPLIPDLLSDMTNFSNPNHYIPNPLVNGVEKPAEIASKSAVSTLDAQEILSGLPGIEITKIDKRTEKNNEVDLENSCIDAQVSIIPSNGSELDLEFDKDDDWLFDSVFKPRDVLEDDMDDEELELEAFKRFCQQSVPPKEKKVAHFNVADIVLKKKLT